jgi:signal transduction histidine kinase
LKYLFAVLIIVITVDCTAKNQFSYDRNLTELVDLHYLKPSPNDKFTNVDNVIFLEKWDAVKSEEWIPNSESTEFVWIKVKLPSANNSLNTLYFNQLVNDYEIYHNNKLIFVRKNVNREEMNSNLWSQNVINLPQFEKGEILLLKIFVYKQQKIYMPTFIAGSSAEIIKFIFIKSIPSSIITALLFISATITFAFFIFIERTKIIFGLLAFLISNGIWVSVNNSIFQIVVNTSITLFFMNNISFQLAGISFFFILAEIVDVKYQKINDLIWKIKGTILFISIFIIANWLRLFDVTFKTILFLNMNFIIIALISLFMSLKKSNIPKRIVMLGMILIMLSVLVQNGISFIKVGEKINTALVDFGTLLFVISIGWLAVSNYLETKKEKEKTKKIEYESIKRENEARFLFSSKLIVSQENERNRIAMELHDSVGQKLLLIKNQVLSRIRNVKENKEAEVLLNVSDLTDEIISEIRNITHNLRPQYLDQLGLNVAIETITEKISELSSLNIIHEIESEINSAISKSDQINFFRIIQESLNNIVKHSHADEVFLRIKKENNFVLLEIRDNGKGFKDYDVKTGTGLISMKERAKMLEAELEIISNENGTKVMMKYPIKLIEDERERN